MTILSIAVTIGAIRVAMLEKIGERIGEVEPLYPFMRRITMRVSAEVTIGIGGGASVTAIITEGSLKNLELKIGDEVGAIFKASSVILGIDE